MDIKQATKAYEAWLGKRIPLIDADLRLKHQRMAESPLPFFRATFYRWTQLWRDLCPELSAGPRVLGIGDLHVENFGTWRDREGRLVWGVNDFDEARSLPYANDLVRLAVSARLAVETNSLSCDPVAACQAILAGYKDSLEKGGKPFVLAESHRWLRDLAMSDLRNPVEYWDKLSRLRTLRKPAPPKVERALRRALPEPGLTFRIVHRRAGVGSLGRRRFTALAEWRGGMIAREAKELTVSAWGWETEESHQTELFYKQAVERAVRAADPFLGFRKQWLLRRLAPDCGRIELASLPKAKDELKLLYAMGWETANIHLGTQSAVRKVAIDLRNRLSNRLFKAVDAMTKATIADWKQWRAR